MFARVRNVTESEQLLLEAFRLQRFDYLNFSFRKSGEWVRNKYIRFWNGFKAYCLGEKSDRIYSPDCTRTFETSWLSSEYTLVLLAGQNNTGFRPLDRQAPSERCSLLRLTTQRHKVQVERWTPICAERFLLFQSGKPHAHFLSQWRASETLSVRAHPEWRQRVRGTQSCEGFETIRLVTTEYLDITQEVEAVIFRCSRALRDIKGR